MADFTYKTVAFPDAVVGIPYEAGIAIASPATAVTAGSVNSGALPTGLVVNATDHIRITGTPTASGLFTFTLSLTDTAGALVSGSYTIQCHPEGSVSSDVYTEGPMPASETVAAEVAREWQDQGTV